MFLRLRRGPHAPPSASLLKHRPSSMIQGFAQPRDKQPVLERSTRRVDEIQSGSARLWRATPSNGGQQLRRAEAAGSRKLDRGSRSRPPAPATPPGGSGSWTRPPRQVANRLGHVDARFPPTIKLSEGTNLPPKNPVRQPIG